MSEILERLRAAGSRVIEDKWHGTITDLLAQGDDLAGEYLGPGTPLEALHDPALEALAILGEPEVKQAALRLGQSGLAWVVGYLDDGDSQAGRLKYISTEATFEERRQFHRSETKGAFDATKEREESWDVLEAGLKRVGKVALKAIGVLLLGAIGL